MTQKVKALHPIRAASRTIKPGEPVDEAEVGPLRLARLIDKGRADRPGEVAPVNRADTKTGKPDLKLPDPKGKFGQ